MWQASILSKPSTLHFSLIFNLEKSKPSNPKKNLYILLLTVLLWRRFLNISRRLIKSKVIKILLTIHSPLNTNAPNTVISLINMKFGLRPIHHGSNITKGTDQLEFLIWSIFWSNSYPLQVYKTNVVALFRAHLANKAVFSIRS